jgi:hypothetical protein
MMYLFCHPCAIFTTLSPLFSHPCPSFV